MIRNKEIKVLLIEVAEEALKTGQPVFNLIKDFLLKVDLEKHPLWWDEAKQICHPINENHSELRARLFDDEGIKQLLMQLPLTERTLIVTHSNIVKFLLMEHPDQ